MREVKFVKGDTVEKQMESIERSLVKFSRRIHKSIIIATPPSIISNYESILPADGVVLRTILPCSGVIKAIESFSTTSNKSHIVLDLYIINMLQQKSISFSNIENIEVEKGDMIAIKMSGDPDLGNIWTSILFIASYKEGSYNPIAIDHLDRTSDSLTEGE